MKVEYGNAVPELAIVRSARSWARLLHRHVVDHGGAVVKTRPLEERQAIEDEYDVLIVDDVSSFLNAHIVEELHRRGRRVLGVYDPEEFSPNGDSGAGKERLVRLGVDGVIDANAAPEDFVRVVRDLVPHRLVDYSQQNQQQESNAADPFAHLIQDQPGAVIHPISAAESDRPRGHITCVLGVSGGVGASEVSIQLARALGQRGERSVVIDADEMVPSLAQRLALPLHPNIRTAVDVVEHGTGRLIDCLTTIDTNLEAMVGLPHPRDWVEVRGADIDAVVSEVARGRHQVVVNVSPFMEDLAPYGSADRFAASRAVASLASAMVVVCPPTPMGIARLIDKAAELAEFTNISALHVVINQAPKDAAKRKEIAAEIERSFQPTSLHFAGLDQRVSAAAWNGVLIQSGDFARCIDTLLAPLIPPRARAASGTQQKTKKQQSPQRNKSQNKNKVAQQGSRPTRVNNTGRPVPRNSQQNRRGA